MKTLANMVAQQASTQAVQQLLGGTVDTANLANVPQALSTPFSFHVNDVRPIKEWAVAAPFEAALIYYLILA